MSLFHTISQSGASEAVTSSGRRTAVRLLAGIGTAGTALLRRSSIASPGSTAESVGAAAAELPAIKRAKKKKGKRGTKGPAEVHLTRKSQDFPVSAGSNANGQVNCPSGEATGGGVGVSNAACIVASSGPVGTKAWGATVTCPGANTATMTVTVICLS